MRGNSAILKCSIPSFVADFVHVVAWIDEDDHEIVTSNDFNGGKMFIVNHKSSSFSSFQTKHNVNPLIFIIYCFIIYLSCHSILRSRG